MNSSQGFCTNCGKPLRSQSRFCPVCGSAVVVSGPSQATTFQADPSAVPPAPGRAGSSRMWPAIIGAVVGAFLILLSAGVYLLRQPGGALSSDAALNLRVVTATALAASAPSASPSPTGPSQFPTATAQSIPATVPPAPTTTPQPTQPMIQTPTSTTAAAYDLYIRRIDYTPGDSDLVAGQPVRFNILIATDLFPDSGPFFPTMRFRWRPGANYDWAEALCPADTHYAKCESTFEFAYAQPGSYDVQVEADHRGEIAETNEGNNVGGVTLHIGAPRPTAAPTSVPKPRPVYSPITFSSAFDEDNQVPISPGKVFQYGVTIIYAYWTYSGVTPDTPFDYDWYRDGVRVDGSGERFVNSAGKAFQWHNYGYTPKDPLEPGNYQFAVRMNGQVILSDTFVIQAPQIGGPVSGAFSLYFTIQNGNPTGWVYDKQGVKHTPSSGTIGDIRVSPGDRIVVQTDSPRFSLLFDCSTTRGTFDPCDFSSDSTANLPREIRAVKRGMSAFMNISRPDNWAGFRSGFEPQRYPADPVLRIMFSW